jgi:MOSC domain-containing protein YiiM
MASTDAVLVSIQVGRPACLGDDAAADPMDRPWTTAFFKQPVSGPVRLAPTNLDGDQQADLENHGGVDKAVCVYSADHYPAWRERLARPDLPWGAFGENFTLTGLLEQDVCVGDVWSIGEEVRVQVSQPRQPCWKLARRWREKTLTAEVIQTGRTGWYFRVLGAGIVEAGMPVTLVERLRPAWTITSCNGVMYGPRGDRDAAARLAAVPELSTAWRETLSRRAAGE